MLPLPSVSDLDVTAEKLKDVEAEYAAAPKGINALGAVDAGLQTADALNERFAKMDAKQRAAEFQKVLDTGWEGYEAALAASPLAADPSLKPLKTGDAKIDAQMLPLKWKEFSEKLAGHNVQADLDAGKTPEEASRNLATIDPKVPLDMAGKAAERKATAAEKEADRTAVAANNTADNLSREKIAGEKIAADKALETLKQTLKDTSVKGPLRAQTEKDAKELNGLNKKMQAMESDLASPAVAIKYNDLAVQRRAVLKRIADAGEKGVMVEAKDDPLGLGL